MTEAEAERFVHRFEAAWQDPDGPGMAPLWHADGVLHAPHFGRPIVGREQAALRTFMRAALPHHAWRLVDWTHRGSRVCILWENDVRVGERTATWRGVDWLTLRDGKIVEEVVHYDTAPLRTPGEPPPPMLPF